MRLKDKLKIKLRKWLEVDIIEETVNSINNEIMRCNAQTTDAISKLDDELYNYKQNNNRRLREQDDKIGLIHKTIENVVHIGTDVRENHYNDNHSWAVICIEGKMNLVKFVDLNRKDAREVLDFLRHFEAGRHCIDTPNQFIYDGLFKFE